MILVLGVWAFVRALLINSAAVSLENVALRHQLAVLQRSVGRPRLRRRARPFWVGLSPMGASWRGSPLLVRPATRLRRHPQAFPPPWPCNAPNPADGRPPP